MDTIIIRGVLTGAITLRSGGDTQSICTPVITIPVSREEEAVVMAAAQAQAADSPVIPRDDFLQEAVMCR
jgi:hypothetical protein